MHRSNALSLALLVSYFRIEKMIYTDRFLLRAAIYVLLSGKVSKRKVRSRLSLQAPKRKSNRVHVRACGGAIANENGGSRYDSMKESRVIFAAATLSSRTTPELVVRERERELDVRARRE